jgi:hypothetical protein
MAPTSPATDLAARVGRLAATFEGHVRLAVTLWLIIEQNTLQIFDQFEKI